MEIYEKLARFYDLEHAALEIDVTFYVHLARQVGGPVLDAGCGSGRLLLPLSQAGLKVTGIDSSSAMLALARQKLERLGQTVRLIEGDMRTLMLEERYGLIIVSINTFMHFQTTADQLAALENLARHLRPGGQLVIDLPAGDELIHQDPDARLTLEQTFVNPDTGGQIIKLSASQVDWTRQLQEIIYVYDETSPDGSVQRTVVPVTLRYVFRYELALLLERAGYQLLTLYGDYDMSLYDQGGTRMIALAQVKDVS
jgi:SAM-dependent methyltransferase